jgi:hypothetical protein
MEEKAIRIAAYLVGALLLLLVLVVFMDGSGLLDNTGVAILGAGLGLVIFARIWRRVHPSPAHLAVIAAVTLALGWAMMNRYEIRDCDGLECIQHDRWTGEIRLLDVRKP